jgi:hypothetical protein
MNDDKLSPAYQALKWTYGLVPLLAGLDKFFNLLAHWESYLSPAVAGLLPFSASTFLHLVGVIEMAVGLAVLTRFTRIGAYVAMVWLILIAGNLLLLGSYDVAVRDLAMAVGAFTLARLAELRQGALAAGTAPRRASQLPA